MFYLIKEDTLKDKKPTFVTGGLGIDYRDPAQTARYVTHDVSNALVFETIEDAKRYITRDYVVAVETSEGFKKA